jgi:hypothetical protein
MTQSDLITEIEEFASAHGIAPATVTSRAVNNSRLYRRLKDGSGCTMRIAERLRAYMNCNHFLDHQQSEKDAA